MLKRICPSLRCSPPPTAQTSLLGTLNLLSRGEQATSPLQRLLKVRDTSGFLHSELLQVAGFVHARRDHQGFTPVSVFPAPLTASLGHTSTHEDAVSFPVSAGFMSLPSGGCLERGPHVGIALDIFHSVTSVLHTWRDLPGVSLWILCTIQFGYTLQFARKIASSLGTGQVFAPESGSCPRGPEPSG